MRFSLRQFTEGRRNRLPHLAFAIIALASAMFASDPGSFLSSYCIGCHGPAVQMAERRFDRLKLPPADADTVILLQEIIDKMNLGSMPPRTAKQPPGPEKQRFVDSLTK